MPKLLEILKDLKNEDLTYRLKFLKIKPRPTKKADLIKALTEAFTWQKWQALWSSLSPLERNTVIEVSYSADLRYNSKRIIAKYGSAPPFHNIPKSSSKYSHYKSPENATRLNLLLYSPKHCDYYVVPEDVAELVRASEPAPAPIVPPSIKKPIKEEGLYIRSTESEALSEVIALLRLAEQGDLRISEKTAMPSAAGCKKILECLAQGDYYPPEISHVEGCSKYAQQIGPIKPVGWSRLLTTGRYLGKVGTKSKLTPAGIKALSLPAHKIIEHLWNKWLSNTAFDEFNRVNDIKGQKSKGHMTAKPPRRYAIIDTLIDFPVNEWVDLKEFATYMLSEGEEFEVSKNLWKLYIGDPEYGSFGYSGYGDWKTVQWRYILAFFFEYLATLGIIDIAYVHPKGALNDFQHQWGTDDLSWLSRYDGLRAFRITNLGAYCLGINEEFTPTQSQSTLTLEVLPNLTICLHSETLSPAEKFLLETWAEPVTKDTWRLEAQRGRDAIERGQNTKDIIAFLNQCDEQPLPETVEGFFKSCESDGKALKLLGDAQWFKCRDEKTADMICSQKQLQQICFKISDTQLSVASAHLPKFRKVVKSMGLGIL
jgi:hypothetical protein